MHSNEVQGKQHRSSWTGGSELEHKMVKEVNRALISDYLKVFFVDLEDNSFVELSPKPEDTELSIEASGDDFFQYTQEYAAEVIYHAELGRFTAAMNKGNLLSLMEDAPFIITYRRIVDGKPVWHTLKALYSYDRKHMLVAVRNIDIQKRRETEYEERLHSMAMLVNRDAMTGVKNRNAFIQEESKWNQFIADEHGDVEFAVVVCDINNLKDVNDSDGHKAGDRVIVEAAKLISDTFKHSPVFRIGGDEFAVVLTGRDYFTRSRLMGELDDEVREHGKASGVLIAGGLATYRKDRDSSFEDVFNRADANMYEKKRAMKSGLV